MLSTRVLEMAKLGLTLWKSSRKTGSKMSTSPSSPLSPSSPSDCGLHRAVEPYTPQHDGEIQLTAGDILINVKDLGNGWTLGKNVTRDTVGIFPSGFIAVMSTYVQPARPAPPPPSQQPGPPPQQPHAGGSSGPASHPPHTPTGSKRRPPKVPVAGASPATRPAHPHHHHQRDAPPTPTGITSRKMAASGDSTPGSTHRGYHPAPPHQASCASLPDPPPYFVRYDSPADGLRPHDVDMPVRSSTLQPSTGPSSDTDFAPNDVEYNSLPTPSKKGNANGNGGKKPHMIVKPNQGKAGPYRMEGTMEGSSEEDCLTPSTTPTGMRPPPPQPPKRTTTSCTADSVTDGDAHNPCCHSYAELRPEDATGGYPSTQDRSTSPRPPNAAMAIDSSVIATHNDNDSDRYNVANDNIQNSPHLTPKERYADIKRTYYKDYRTLDCPQNNIDPNYVTHTQYKPILKNRHQKVGDSAKGQHITFREPSSRHKSSRLILSILAGFFFGFILFLWMYYCLEYGFMITVVSSGIVAILLIIFFAMSRLCCCIAALLLPSLCTTRGRISFLLLITGFLLRGPVDNIYHNMEDVSRSMACSAEQSYNQTMLLLSPFDGMMVQLNNTIMKLQHSSHQVSRGLAPLDAGLDKVEMDLQNGQIQLQGTQKTCRSMVDRAFNACATGIHSAQDQCMGVMGALGTVYHHALTVLDTINPNRWAPKTQAHLLLKKRQALTSDDPDMEGIPTMPENDKDICDPLDTVSVCNALNDSRMLCKPSSWAGEAIQDAINRTQRAMHSLQSTLQFTISYEPYHDARANATNIIFEIRKKVQEEFERHTRHFELVTNILRKLIPLALILLIYVSYLHIKHYMCRDTYDNIYITSQFKGLDKKRAQVAGDNLLPLKRYERNYLVDMSMSDLSAPEDGLYRIGLCVMFLHLAISFCCYMFDLILYWVLNVVQRHGRPSFDITGRDSLDYVISGEGVIADLLTIFLEGFHAGKWFGFSSKDQMCLPQARAPSVINLIVVVTMYCVLIMTILFKAYILRFRNMITGFFYPEREKARIVHLYNVILNQRSRMPRLLHQRVKINQREQAILEQVSFCHKVAARCPPCRMFLYKSSRCLVCGRVEDQTFCDCQTEKCPGSYCCECYEDLGRVCPLCLQGDYSDDEDYEELEDDLQPYCRSSKIYL